MLYQRSCRYLIYLTSSFNFAILDLGDKFMITFLVTFYFFYLIGKQFTAADEQLQREGDARRAKEKREGR